MPPSASSSRPSARRSASPSAEDAEVELTLAGDAEMERLNFDHMGERGPTDVLSFPLHEWSLNGSQSHLTDDDGVSPPGPLFLGDVVVDLDQALRQSAEGDWGVIEELVLLTIHGTLHLVGHDHADIDEEERMRRLEHDVLGGAASAPPRDRLAAGFPVRSRRPRSHDRQLHGAGPQLATTKRGPARAATCAREWPGFVSDVAPGVDRAAARWRASHGGRAIAVVGPPLPLRRLRSERRSLAGARLQARSTKSAEA